MCIVTGHIQMNAKIPYYAKRKFGVKKWSSMYLIFAIIEVAKYASFVYSRCSPMPFKIAVFHWFTMIASTAAAGLLLCVVRNCNTVMMLCTLHTIYYRQVGNDNDDFTLRTENSTIPNIILDARLTMCSRRMRGPLSRVTNMWGCRW